VDRWRLLFTVFRWVEKEFISLFWGIAATLRIDGGS
jgi:hypothetical protein